MEAFELPAPTGRPAAGLVWHLSGDELALSPALAALLGEAPADLAGFCARLAGGPEGSDAASLQQALARLADTETQELELGLAGSRYRCQLQVLLHQGQVSVSGRLEHCQGSPASRELFNQLAHDLRNALSSVGGFSQLLRRRNLVSGEALAGVERMHRAAEEAHQLLQAMLLAREFEHSVPVATLGGLLSETLRWFTIRAREKGLEFVSHVPEHLPNPALPALWFERLLKQLLDNALRFTAGGGRIELELLSEGGRLLLRISDTGVGVPAELQPRLFEKVALRDARSGGMGLYLTRLIVEQYGGSIVCESPCSDTGTGSCFSISLPLAAP